MRPLHDFGELIFTEIMKLCIAPIEGVFNADGPSAVRVPSWPVLRRKRDRRAEGIAAAWRQAKALLDGLERGTGSDGIADVVSELPATRVSRDRSSARPRDLCGSPRAGPDRCPHCGFENPYRLTARLFDAPFRCPDCRRPYAGSLWYATRPRVLKPDLRIAMTRAFFNR